MENCVARTNWFRVKDPIGLMSALEKVVVAESGSLQIFTKHHDDGIDFAFGCKSEIKGYAVGDAETDIYPFLEELVDVVSDGDAIILQEVRNDNLRYVTAFVRYR